MARAWLVLAGGGTGGHLYPGLAMLDALRRIRNDFDVTIFGTPRAIDEKLLTSRGLALVQQDVRPIPSSPLGWPTFGLALWRSIKTARQSFAERAPAVVFGLGGYAAAPAMIAASQLGVPTILFNPDAELGRANRHLLRYAHEIVVQWRTTSRQLAAIGKRVETTGCPVREAVVRATADEGRRRFRLDPAKKTLLVTGASQGARSLNLVMIELAGHLRPFADWQVVHVTGPSDQDEVRAAYGAQRIAATVMEYSEDLPYALAASDLVLSRAGASTLAEITARGVTSILMPYPYDRRQHQRANAAVLEEAGAATVVPDRKDPKRNAAALRGALEELMRFEERRKRMAAAARALGREDAAAAVARRVCEVAGWW